VFEEQILSSRGTRILHPSNSSIYVENKNIASLEQISSTQGTKILWLGTNIVYLGQKNIASWENISSSWGTKILHPRNNSHHTEGTKT
jgi:hypothetical protein